MAADFVAQVAKVVASTGGGRVVWIWFRVQVRRTAGQVNTASFRGPSAVVGGPGMPMLIPSADRSQLVSLEV
jgi:hypothetical protein